MCLISEVEATRFKFLIAQSKKSSLKLCSVSKYTS